VFRSSAAARHIIESGAEFRTGNFVTDDSTNAGVRWVGAPSPTIFCWCRQCATHTPSAQAGSVSPGTTDAAVWIGTGECTASPMSDIKEQACADTAIWENIIPIVATHAILRRIERACSMLVTDPVVCDDYL